MRKIGIIGAGIIERTLAEYSSRGFLKEKLLISYSGKLLTYKNIEKTDLVETITKQQDMQESINDIYCS